MLRPIQALLGVALLAGCSPPGSGGGRWLTQPTTDQHTSLFFPISAGSFHAMGSPAVHVAGNIDCNSCHGTSDTFGGFDCLTCHTPTPTIPNHVQKNVGGFSYDSPSCYGCHPDGIGKGSVDHTHKFPIAPGQVHATGAPAIHVAGTIQCTSCHANIADRSKVDCTICHDAADQSAKHAGLIGPEPGNGTPLWSGSGPVTTGETSNCLLCHSNGALQRVATHGQNPALPGGFLVARGNHLQSCEQCHTSRMTDPARKNPEIDFAAMSCANCHTQAIDLIATKHATFNVNLTSPPATTPTCLSCHPDGGTAAGFQHPSFPVASGAVHALGAPAVHLAGTIGCASCHTPAANSAGDYKQVDCTVCHTAAAMQPLHAAVADLPASYASPDPSGFPTTARCLRCHADSTVPVSIAAAHVPPAPAHTPFLIGSGAPHYRKDCLGCHLASRLDKPWAADFAAQPRHCTGCHLDPKTSTNHLGTSWSGYPGTYSYNDSACITCHPSGDIGPFVHTNFPTTATDMHNSSIAGCTDCHANTATPTDVNTINCIGCHTNTTSSVDPGGINSRHTTPAIPVAMAGYAFANASCLKCHAGTVATPSWKNPLLMRLLQHNSLCFGSGITSGNHSVNKTSGTTPICFTCHDTMNAPVKPWGVNWAQAQCTPCHTGRTPPTCR
jgi:hypothetical protein